MSLSLPASDAQPGLDKRGRLAVARDYWALTKPSINRMCLVMAGGGMFLATSHAELSLSPWQALVALVGTALAVASANALNMWLERDADKLMRRTKDRPLAAERISADGALLFGVSPIDPLTYGTVVVALGTVALVATWRRTRRDDTTTAS